MAEERFFVKQVTLENYRGFAAKAEVSFHPRLTVFAGVNGCGKTSLLEALAKLLSGAIEMLERRTQILVDIDASDVGPNASKTRLWIELSSGKEVVSWDVSRDLDEESFGDSGGRVAPSMEDYPLLNRLANSKDDRSVVLPILEFIHSGSTRMPLKHDYGQAHPRLVAYRGCLDSEAHQFTELEDWFEQEENLENAQKVQKGNLGLQIPSLRAVRGAVATFLSHLHESRLSRLTVVRYHDIDPLKPAKGQLAMDKDGRQLMLSQLSDGERRLVLLVADVARRMALLNPGLPDPLRTPGVILIDEIELHLHPTWQRTVIAALQAAFPNVQFVLTTHSPQVLASVPDESVVLLKDGAALPGHPRVKGRDTNTILEETMDATARPAETQAWIDALYDLIERAPNEARARLDELEAELGSDEPELVRARAMMEFAGVGD